GSMRVQASSSKERFCTFRSAGNEVDRDRYALELEALAQLVLDPVAVVASDQGRVVDRETEARGSRGYLRSVEEVQAPTLARRGLAPLTELCQKTVELGRRDACGVLVVELFDRIEQPLDPAAGLRGHGDVRWTLAQPTFQLGSDVFDAERRRIPFREHDDRRVLRLPRDVGDGEIVVDEAFGRVHEDERDVRTLGRFACAQLRVVLDPLPVPALAADACGVDEDESAIAALEAGVDRVAG